MPGKRRKASMVYDTLIELGFGPERKVPTMRALAQQTGIQGQTIWGWLAGDRWPRLDHAMALATVLGVSLGTLATAMKNAQTRAARAAEVRDLLRAG